MTLETALVWVVGLAATALVLCEFIRALWPRVQPAELEQRALTELALLRDEMSKDRAELSKLRAETLKDRDELRDVASKHERAFVETTHRVNDCLKETTKLSLAYGSGQQVRR